MLTAFYGGSFDPPHIAHVFAVTYLRAVGGFDHVLIAPVFRHAFYKQLTSFDDRVAMGELAMGWLPGVEVSRIEERLSTPSYTLNTLRALIAERPGERFRLVVGSDVLSETCKWHAFDEISELAPPFVLERAGFTGECGGRQPLLPRVSSTEVRRHLACRGSSFADAELARMVPSRVLEYIDARGLYR
ncbi:MAG: nicotinate-nicotinamide nucleotide adenylyltransferase [Sorangiineae bacterium]|nr:nicotinate-nicotinamide nucleotide adenylyltransferase [Polyangiaceae bacterium]MEB2320921.1 nicotinate-nicotinamide nucleotide adenylyltransferase [Sorangiineae bacterium]